MRWAEDALIMSLFPLLWRNEFQTSSEKFDNE